MITSVRLINFKNFADETLKLGPFTVIVGANASGKSNIRDAFRFLHGIGRGYALSEITGGKIGVGGQLEWEPIRGAPNSIARLTEHLAVSESSFGIHVDSQSDCEKRHFEAKIGFDQLKPDRFQMLGEKLNTVDSMGYESNPNFETTFWLTIGDGDKKLGISRSKPALSQLATGHFTYARYRGWGYSTTWQRCVFLSFCPVI